METLAWLYSLPPTFWVLGSIAISVAAMLWVALED
jgi:hypothetical protein